MAHSFNLPVLENAPCAKTGGRDFFTLIQDIGELAALAEGLSEKSKSRKRCTVESEWTGRVSWQDAVKFTRDGDFSRVAPSDAFMTQFETIAPTRKAWATVDDVVGAFPNIPATIAGIPTAMRRRTRIASAQAPLCVVVDVASSGGIDAKKLERRGAAILALVRALSTLRPVELWAGVSATPYGKTNAGAWHIFTKIETAPLDIARAAHVLVCPAVARAMLYGLVHKAAGDEKEEGLQWPYNSHSFSREHGREIIGRAIGEDEIFYIAPPYVEDQLVNKPEAWLTEAIKTWGGVNVEP